MLNFKQLLYFILSKVDLNYEDSCGYFIRYKCCYLRWSLSKQGDYIFLYKPLLIEKLMLS